MSTTESCEDLRNAMSLKDGPTSVKLLRLAESRCKDTGSAEKEDSKLLEMSNDSKLVEMSLEISETITIKVR